MLLVQGEKEMETILTNHAAKRLKERLGIKSLSEKQRIADLALLRGKAIRLEQREFDGDLRENILIEYQERVFVFSNNKVLITVLPKEMKYRPDKEGVLRSLSLMEAKKEMAYA